MRRVLSVIIGIQLSMILSGQILADQSVVDLYDDIPQQWIDSVKTMWLSYAGESHSAAIRDGLNALESLDATYQVETIESGTPEGTTSSYLRANRATWGDLNNTSGWIYDYGEEDWGMGSPYAYTLDQDAVDRTKAGITYCNSIGNPITVFAFGHCYDDGINLAYSYVAATKQYIDYCADSIPTKVIFTTGPNDGYMAADGASGYEQYQKWEIVRDSVDNDPTRILFDYADILSYNNSGEVQTATYNGNTFPVCHDDNMEGTYTGHIGTVGALRLAKAMWWMLARMAGWDGTINGEDTEAPSAPSSLNLNSVSQSAVSIAWAASSDNLGVTEYIVYRDGVYLGSSSELSFTDNTLSVCDTYFYTVKAVDAAGNESSSSSGLSVANCAPDVTPTLIVTPNISHGLTRFEVIVRITELNLINTNANIIVNIPADPRWSLEGAYDPSLLTLDGIDLDNDAWAYSSDAVNHTFTTSSPIPAGGFSTFGFRITFNPDISRGLYTITSHIVSGGGGEVRESNNVDSERLDYFQKKSKR
jgi:hypothetical protein